MPPKKNNTTYETRIISAIRDSENGRNKYIHLNTIRAYIRKNFQASSPKVVSQRLKQMVEQEKLIYQATSRYALSNNIRESAAQNENTEKAVPPRSAGKVNAPNRPLPLPADSRKRKRTDSSKTSNKRSRREPTAEEIIAQEENEQQFQNRIEELDQQNRVISNDLERTRSEYDQVFLDLNALRNELLAKEQQIQTLLTAQENGILNMETQINAKENELGNLQLTYRESLERISVLENELEVATIRCRYLENQLSTKETEHEKSTNSLEADVQTMHGELSAIRDLAQSAELDLVNLRQQLISREADLQATIQEASNRNNTLEQKIAVILSENEHLKLVYEEKVSNISLLDAEISSQHQELEKLESKIVESSESYNKLSSERSELQALLDFQCQKYQELEHLADATKQKFNESETNLQKSLTENNCLIEQAISSQNVLQALQDSYQKTTEHLAEVKLECENLKSAYDTACVNIEQGNQRFLELETALSIKQQEILRSRAHILSIKSQLEAIDNEEPSVDEFLGQDITDEDVKDMRDCVYQLKRDNSSARARIVDLIELTNSQDRTISSLELNVLDINLRLQAEMEKLVNITRELNTSRKENSVLEISRNSWKKAAEKLTEEVDSLKNSVQESQFEQKQLSVTVATLQETVNQRENDIQVVENTLTVCQHDLLLSTDEKNKIQSENEFLGLELKSANTMLHEKQTHIGFLEKKLSLAMQANKDLSSKVTTWQKRLQVSVLAAMNEMTDSVNSIQMDRMDSCGDNMDMFSIELENESYGGENEESEDIFADRGINMDFL